MGRKIPIEEANGKFVEFPFKPKMKGLVFNSVYDGSEIIFNLLRIPSFDNLSERMSKKLQVVQLPQDEIDTVVYKFRGVIAGRIPYDKHALDSSPEIFVTDGNGVIIPAFKFLGDKTEGEAFLHESKTAGEAFHNGFHAKFNTDTSNSIVPECLSVLVDTVRYGLQHVICKAREFNPRAKLVWNNVLDVPNEIMDRTATKHKKLWHTASKNAYSHTYSPKIGNPLALSFRSIDCPLRFNLGSLDEEVEEAIVKSIDAVWGVTSVSLLRGMEDKRDGAFYDRAGRYGTTPNGIEYRATSSAILAHPVLFNLAFDISRAAISMATKGLRKLWIGKEDDIVHTINSHDVPRAEKIIKRNELVLKAILRKRYKTSVANKVLDMVYAGALTYFNGLKSMEESWRLYNDWEEYGETSGCAVYNAKELE